MPGSVSHSVDTDARCSTIGDMANVRGALVLAFSVLLLAGCPSTDDIPPGTRIALFEVEPSTVERGAGVPVTVRWRVEGAGSQPGMAPCRISRHVEGEPPQDPFPVACSSSLSEVPPAGASATFVRYEVSALRAPFVPADPYITEQVTVTVTGGPAAFGPFGVGTVLGDVTGTRQRYNREFVAVDSERVFYSRTRGTDFTLLEGSVSVHERVAAGNWTPGALLEPPPGEAYSEFGAAVVARGTTLVVLGHRRVSVEPSVYESVLHVYEEGTGGAWAPRAVLLQGEGVGTWLGTFPAISVALATDVVVVGLPSREPGVPSEVRVYGRNVGGSDAWGVAATIPSPTSLSEFATGYFGTDVDLSEDGRLLAVATSFQGDDSCLGDTVHVFERTAASVASWILTGTLGSGEAGGCSTYLAIDGDTLALTGIGANLVSLRIFERGAGTGGPDDWAESRTHHFTVPTYANSGAFWSASSIRLRQDTIVLGMAAVQCIGMDPSSPCTPGLVQVVRRDSGGVGAWGVDQVLEPDPAYPNQGFGVAVDLSTDGRFLVVGTGPQPTDDPSRGGEVFVFER